MTERLTIVSDPVTSCDGCGGACCRVVKIAVQAMTPDQLRWANMRGGIAGGYWHINSVCENLTDDGKCGIYNTRPDVCRQFEVGGSHCLDARAINEQKKGTAHGDDNEQTQEAGAGELGSE